MGLSKAALRFIVIEHRRKPLGGHAVTLGRQCVYARFADIKEIFLSESLQIAEIPPDISLSTNIPNWQGTPREKNTSDVAFFHALGITQVEALDVDAFEGAEIIWDLNRPVPSELESRFDLIVDSGTLEHVFDVRTAMKNLARMLRRGGRIMHLSPSNNFCNHGFFQFSPTFFADFYTANLFREVRVYVAEESQRYEETQKLDLFEFDVRSQPCMMASPVSKRLLTLCIAEKCEESTDDRVPTQSYYRKAFAAASQSAMARQLAEEQHVPASRAAQLIKRWLPFSTYVKLRGGWMSTRKWLLGAAETQKPWGLKFWRRLE